MEINKLFKWKNKEFFIGHKYLLQEIKANYLIHTAITPPPPKLPKLVIWLSGGHLELGTHAVPLYQRSLAALQ